MTVLVAYATGHGSTREIARSIAATLEDSGIEVEVRSILDLEDLSGFSAFVLGSAVHNRAWLPEPLAFVRAHRQLLRTRPVWFFSVGMPAALRGPMKRLGEIEGRQLAVVLDEFVPLAPHRLFSGRYLREHTSLGGHLLFRAIGGRYGDYRDPEAVDAYARQISRRLVPA
jgi:menaquinone-dependent protoporphyrinogen oxidase